MWKTCNSMRFFLKTEKYYSTNEIFNLELTLKLILAPPYQSEKTKVN